MTNNGTEREKLMLELGPARGETAYKLGKMSQHDKQEQKGEDIQGEVKTETRDRRRVTNVFSLGKELLYGGQGKISCDKCVRPNENSVGLEGNNKTAEIREGLHPPRLNDDSRVVIGSDRVQLRKENKKRRREAKAEQAQRAQWTVQQGKKEISEGRDKREQYRNAMCPTGYTMKHPAADTLRQWASMGCPTRTGRQWTKEEVWQAVARGPHQSALAPEALQHFADEAREKVDKGQARVVLWDDIKDNPPPELKISPIAAIPHKSKAYRSILDLSFRLRLQNGGVISSVNDTTEKRAPKGAIDQIGESLTRIIHAFAEAEEDAKVFMAKWDIKDGFWRMDCEEGQEWNFSYVLPQPEGEPTKIVVPTSLQMGWVESPPYFCAATETARDTAAEYIETPVASLPDHKFLNYSRGDKNAQELPATTCEKTGFRYLIEVYVDDFMSLVIPTSQEQLDHVANAIMKGIHEVFPEDKIDSNDPISEKKLLKNEGQYSTRKTLLGFDFDGENKTMWLEEAKREKLLTILKTWIRTGTRGRGGVKYKEFESVVAKIRHAFTCNPMGVALLSTCNRVLKAKPTFIYLHKNQRLLQALKGCRTLLRESMTCPTRCRELTSGWPDFVGIVDASSHGAGGVVFGELSTCIPTVFRLQWPETIRASVITGNNPQGTISNSDLEMAGILLLWLVMEGVTSDLREKRVAMLGDNVASISWVHRLASKQSLIAEELIQALALRLKTRGTCPPTTVHIEGKRNQIADVPSRSFGSNPAWNCNTHVEFHNLFNSLFPLPKQNSWTVFHLNSRVVTRVISILQMKQFELEEWRKLPELGRHGGIIGKSMSNLWESIHTCSTLPSSNESGHSQDSRHEQDQDIMERKDRYNVAQSLAQSRPLARRSPWPTTTTQQK